MAITYGTDLHDIKVYYTFNDQTYYSEVYNANLSLGRWFLHHIDDDTLDLKLASSRHEGIEKIEDGRAWAYFDIPANYSEKYVNRLQDVCESVNNGEPPDSDLSGAVIELVMDVTSQRITFAINDALNDAANRMKSDFVKRTNFCESYFDPPIKIADYVYGDGDLKVTDFFIPGLLAPLSMAISIALTALNLIIDRKSGLFDRSWVAGVTVIEVVVSQLVAYGVITCLQAVLLIVFGIYVVNVEREGSILLAYILVCIVGMTGVSLGLALSAYLGTEDAALQTALGLIYPLYLTGGVFWPVQSFSEWARVATHLGPVTYPAESMRDIITKDLGIGDYPVYYGFIVPIVWFIIFTVVASLGVHLRRF